MKPAKKFNRLLFSYILALALLSGCMAFSTPASLPTATSVPATLTPSLAQPVTLETTDEASSFNPEQIATLDSLTKVDDYPLYTMRYLADYSQDMPAFSQSATIHLPKSAALPWGCSLFAALGDPSAMLFGRNFDWQFSPVVLLFTDPPDGYSSVSVVDFAYLGFQGSQVYELNELPLSERQALLSAPLLPFDGLNENGLTVGMAAVPPGNMPVDSHKETIDSILVIRLMLDRARNVDEALAILSEYNLNFAGGPPLHYLLADASGSAILVEFYQGEMHVLSNQNPWHLATNFLVSSTNDSPQDHCWRYDRISERLSASGGSLSVENAIDLLSQVAQGNTQWSVVYGLQSKQISVVMGRDYENVHTFNLRDP
jgi:hypothetical protein